MAHKFKVGDKIKKTKAGSDLDKPPGLIAIWYVETRYIRKIPRNNPT